MAAEQFFFKVNNKIISHNNSVVSGIDAEHNVYLDCYLTPGAEIYEIDSAGSSKLKATSERRTTSAHYIRYSVPDSEKSSRHKYRCTDNYLNVQVILDYGKAQTSSCALS